VEPTGDLTFDEVDPGANIALISLSPDMNVAPDQAVWSSFDQDRTLLFNGRTLLAPLAE